MRFRYFQLQVRTSHYHLHTRFKCNKLAAVVRRPLSKDIVESVLRERVCEMECYQLICPVMSPVAMMSRVGWKAKSKTMSLYERVSTSRFAGYQRMLLHRVRE